MKKIGLFLCLLLISFPAFAAEKESAFDRIMRTGTIRCGYYVFPPVMNRDPATGELSGFSVDMMNRIAQRGGLKIEWTEEVTFGNWPAALQANRFDVACTPMWPDIPLARGVAFTDPMFFAGLYPMVRADDTRFANAGVTDFNKPDIIFLTQDGDVASMLVTDAFPLAKNKSVTAATDGPTMMQDLVTKKADVMLTDRNMEIAHNKNNPIKMRLITKDGPVKLQAFTLAAGRQEIILQDWLNTAIRDLLNDGTMDRLLAKWEPEPHTFLRARSAAEVKPQ